MEKSVEKRLAKLLKRLKTQAKKQELVFVSGKGKRRQPLQRDIETVSEWLRRMKEYQNSLHICGERGSYSKTDKDATFMHAKEDHMRNRQLKPCYNVNAATASEYVIGSYLSADCTDTNTLIPFTKQFPWIGFKGLLRMRAMKVKRTTPILRAWSIRMHISKPANHEQKKPQEIPHRPWLA